MSSPSPSQQGALNSQASRTVLSRGMPGLSSKHALGGSLTSSTSLPGLDLSSVDTLPRGRGKRHFAAVAEGTERLKQMVAILQGAEVAAHKLRGSHGLDKLGIVEEGQLYHVCFCELAKLVGAHSPTLSQLTGALFSGFAGLYGRTLRREEARLARQREEHEVTKARLAEARGDAEHARAEHAALEKRLFSCRRALNEKEKKLQDLKQELALSVESNERLRASLVSQLQASSTRAAEVEEWLENHANASEGGARFVRGSAEPANGGRQEERRKAIAPAGADFGLRDSLSLVERAVAAAEEENDRVGRSADNLRRLVRSMGQELGGRGAAQPPAAAPGRAVSFEEVGCQTDGEPAPPAPPHSAPGLGSPPSSPEAPIHGRRAAREAREAREAERALALTSLLVHEWGLRGESSRAQLAALRLHVTAMPRRGAERDACLVELDELVALADRLTASSRAAGLAGSPPSAGAEAGASRRSRVAGASSLDPNLEWEAYRRFVRKLHRLVQRVANASPPSKGGGPGGGGGIFGSVTQLPMSHLVSMRAR